MRKDERNMKKVSVFMPVLIRDDAGFAMTKACVELMRGMTEVDFELVIVETISRKCAFLADKYIWQEEQPGIGRTHNVGFEACSHDLRALMSNDVFVTKGWLEALMKPFELFDDCGASTIAACEIGQKRSSGPEYSEGIYFPCSMWRKQFASYDESFIDTWSDADMCLRMYIEGYRMIRNSEAMAHHFWAGTIKPGAEYDQNWQENFERFKEKHKAHENRYIYKVFTEGIIL